MYEYEMSWKTETTGRGNKKAKAKRGKSIDEGVERRTEPEMRPIKIRSPSLGTSSISTS